MQGPRLDDGAARRVVHGHGHDLLGAAALVLIQRAPGAVATAGDGRAHFLATSVLDTANLVSLLHNAGGAITMPEELLSKYRIKSEKDPKLWVADKSGKAKLQIKAKTAKAKAPVETKDEAVPAWARKAKADEKTKDKTVLKANKADDERFDGIDFDEL